MIACDSKSVVVDVIHAGTSRKLLEKFHGVKLAVTAIFGNLLNGNIVHVFRANVFQRTAHGVTAFVLGNVWFDVDQPVGINVVKHPVQICLYAEFRPFGIFVTHEKGGNALVERMIPTVCRMHNAWKRMFFV